MILLATATAGALLIIAGLQIRYPSRTGVNVDDPTQTPGLRAAGSAR